MNAYIYNVPTSHQSLLVTANLLNKKFIGIEQEKEFIQMSIARKNELDSQRKDIESRIKDLLMYRNTNNS